MYTNILFLGSGPPAEPYAQSGTTDVSFTGMNSDTTSNVYDFLYREYSNQGRWSSPDPAGLAAVDPTNPQSWNRYAYVRNNPLLLTDALGLTTCDANGNNCYDSVTVNGDTGGVSWSDGGADGYGSDHYAPLLDGGGGIGGSIKRIVNAACTPIADVGTIGGGADLGAGGAIGLSDGVAINGRSGEVSPYVTGTFSGGYIGPDAYVSAGFIPNAPSNAQALNGVSTGVAVAVQRFGGSVSTSVDPSAMNGSGINTDPTKFNYQGTVGPSVLPVTFAGQISYTKVLFSIPYLGYALHPTRAVCKLVTGH